MTKNTNQWTLLPLLARKKTVFYAGIVAGVASLALSGVASRTPDAWSGAAFAAIGFLLVTVFAMAYLAGKTTR